MLRLERLELCLHRTNDCQAEIPAEVDRFRPGSRHDELAPELTVDRDIEAAQIVAQAMPLAEARQHLDCIRVKALDILWITSDRGGAELGRDGRPHLLGRIPNDVVEGIVPATQEVEEGRPTFVALCDQLAREIQDTVNVVIVHMADHQDVNGKCLCRADLPRCSNLAEP
ncbi:hypothetical protein [Microvirga pakistanensis]|uniref:hypothetical protein n=1 Tax=Microvirga pakistanensis TaxID=1682650 RepID=UPI001FCEC92D|nr:hypothetical protein [Microvirga pakistanensis]